MSFTVRRLADDKKRRKIPWKRIALTALKLSGPVMTAWEFLRARQQKVKKEKEERARTNLLKRILVILVAILCAAILFAETAKALVSLKILNIHSIASIAGSTLPTDQYGHTNILLLGRGDANHDGVDLTDTIMIASIDPKTHSVVMFSIPRDLYLLSTQHMGKGRINTMYRDYKDKLIGQGMDAAQASSTSMKEVASELGNALGIQIHDVAILDFSGFTQAVDAIGGVDVDVPTELIDTQYPVTETTYGTIDIPAGLQHMDGETALEYARSRHSTSDFDRSRRQQQIIKAVETKVKTQGVLTKPNDILSLLNILKDHVETTLTVRDMLSLANLGSQIQQDNIISLQLNDQNGLYNTIPSPGGLLYTPPRNQFNGASVLLPVSIPPTPITWKQIDILVNMLVNERTPYVDKTPIDVLNAGAKPGLAGKLGGELTRFDFVPATVANADKSQRRPDSIIQAPEAARDKATFLSNMLKIPLSLIPAEGSGAQTGSGTTENISILLGKDYTYTPVQTLVSPQQ
ncbi:MAG TPA: LCP family protein [Candidatus Peribacteraceae bacterium]|nr:LCP family protein [Candidatus Peribacteraceae bacterium]